MAASAETAGQAETLPPASSILGSQSTVLFPLEKLQKPACAAHGVTRDDFDEYHAWAADLAREACVSLDLYGLCQDIASTLYLHCLLRMQATEMLCDSSSFDQQIFLSDFYSPCGCRSM